MSEHRIIIQWQRRSESFQFEDYNRQHCWAGPDGEWLQVSAAPAYFGDPDLLNPEQALAGSLSSCHMLTFLAVASKQGIVPDSYQDTAVAHLGRNEQGKMAVIRIELYPKVRFALGQAISQEIYQDLHERAHKACFVANALSCAVQISPELVAD